MNINVLIQVAGIANFARNGDEVGERFADGFGGLDGREDAADTGRESAQGGKAEANITGTFRRLRGFIQRLGDVRASLIEDNRGFCQPGCRIFLQIEDLKVGDGSVTGIDLVALGKQRLGKIVGPACLSAFDLNEGGLDDVAQRNQRRRPQAACPIQARSSGWQQARCSDPLLIRQAHIRSLMRAAF